LSLVYLWLGTINYSSPTDLQWLQNEYFAWFSPRYCGADDTQCLTFGLGECVLNSNVSQCWYNGDPDLECTVEGSEGGCLCYNSYPTGFFQLQTFCQQCVPGYGPNTISDLGTYYQYDQIVSQTVVNTSFFNDITGITPQEFDSRFICRYPIGVDPIAGKYFFAVDVCILTITRSIYRNNNKSEYMRWSWSNGIHIQ